MGLFKIDLCFVYHIKYACAISLEMHTPEREPFKLTYSGDCAPSKYILNTGKNSTILIHEATFEDDLSEMAKKKNHSTISAAIEQGVKMNAKYTILTHFSQRYRIPIIEKRLPTNVSPAFDNMEIVLSDLQRAHHLQETLQHVYADHIAKHQALANKRERRRWEIASRPDNRK